MTDRDRVPEHVVGRGSPCCRVPAPAVPVPIAVVSVPWQAGSPRPPVPVPIAVCGVPWQHAAAFTGPAARIGYRVAAGCNELEQWNG